MADDHTDEVRQSLLSDKPSLTSNSFNKKHYLHKRILLPRCTSAPPPPDHIFPDRNDAIPRRPRQHKIVLGRVLILLVSYLGIGTLCFYLVRHQIEGVKTNGVVDAIYFCVVTMTTVGYGDLVPHSTLAKLLSCVYVFTGVALGGLILGEAADYLVEKQEIILVTTMHLYEETNCKDDPIKEVQNHKVKNKFFTAAFMLFVFVVVGIVVLALVENFKIVDAFYCVCTTITTLGYGDKSFSTEAGRIFAVFWIIGSTIFLAQFFLYLAEIYTERRQGSFVKWVLSRQLTYSDLEAADLNHDNVVSVAEFIVYKLKEMGKISEEDISLLIERFRKLDTNNSGTLAESDIMILTDQFKSRKYLS